MKIVGTTSSSKNIYYQRTQDWIDAAKKEKLILSDRDVFESYCVMSHIANLQLTGKASKYPEARLRAMETESYLRKKTNWFELKKRMGVLDFKSIVETGE